MQDPQKPIEREFSVPFSTVITLGQTFVVLGKARQPELVKSNTKLEIEWFAALDADIEALKLLPVVQIRQAEGRGITELRDDEMGEAENLLQSLFRAAPRALPHVAKAADLFGQQLFTHAAGSPEKMLTAVRMGAKQANAAPYRQQLLDAGFPEAKILRLQELAHDVDEAHLNTQVAEREGVVATEAIVEQFNKVWRKLRTVRDAVWDTYPVGSDERRIFRLYADDNPTREYTLAAGARKGRTFGEASLADPARTLSLSIDVPEGATVQVEFRPTADAPFQSPQTFGPTKPRHPHRVKIGGLGASDDAPWLVIEAGAHAANVTATLLD